MTSTKCFAICGSMTYKCKEDNFLHYFVEAVSQSHKNMLEKHNVMYLLRTDRTFLFRKRLEEHKLPALKHPRPCVHFDILSAAQWASNHSLIAMQLISPCWATRRAGLNERVARAKS